MPKKTNYNFSGIATAYDVLCGDGRLIKNGSFDWQEDQVIPMVWRHQHSNPTNFLGHGLLKKSNSPSGMRVIAFFNGTTEGQHAKQMVEEKEIKHLSIWANELTENNLQHAKYGAVLAVEKGTIREFSLVRSGQNPGALIDDVIVHSLDPYGDEIEKPDGVIVHTAIPIEIYEPEPEPEPEVKPEVEPKSEPEADPVVEHASVTGVSILESLNEEQRVLFNVILHSAMTGTSPSSGDEKESSNSGGKTLKEVFDSLSEEQKEVLYFMAGELSQNNLSQGDTDMPKESLNIFENDDDDDGAHFSHEEIRFVESHLLAAFNHRCRLPIS